MRKFLGLMLSLAVVVGLGVSSARASCGTPTYSSVSEPDSSYYAYLYFSNTLTSNFVGNFWQNGAKTAMNGDAMPADNWIGCTNTVFPCSGGGATQSFFIRLDGGGVLGCPQPGSSMSVFLDNCASNEALLLTVPQTPAGESIIQWSFTNRNFPSTNLTPGPSPRPHINSSSRVGDTVNVAASVADVSSIQKSTVGSPGLITETRIYSRRFTNNLKPPTGSATGWTLRNTFAGAAGSGPTPVSVTGLDCTGADPLRDDLWLATGIVVNGDVILGCPVPIECGGNLADPTGRPNRKLDRTGDPKTQNPQ
jgi:hypothetical protein